MFYKIDLDARQLRQANNSASIVKRAKERDFAIAKCERKCCKRPYRHVAIIERV